jgi:hypothetical protein
MYAYKWKSQKITSTLIKYYIYETLFYNFIIA